MRSHLLRHEGLEKSKDNTDEEAPSNENEKSTNLRIYACHCCEQYFKAGNSLTKHLIKVHGYSRASGFHRFRYVFLFFDAIPIHREFVFQIRTIGR
jgi:hypothetical protein